MDLTKLARDKPCLLRIPGVCNFNNKTTVLCHIKREWCATIKPPDVCAVWGCHDCHAVIDGRNTHSGYSRADLAGFILTALLRQITWYFEYGYLTVVNPK